MMPRGPRARFSPLLSSSLATPAALPATETFMKALPLTRAMSMAVMASEMLARLRAFLGSCMWGGGGGAVVWMRGLSWVLLGRLSWVLLGGLRWVLLGGLSWVLLGGEEMCAQCMGAPSPQGRAPSLLTMLMPAAAAKSLAVPMGSSATATPSGMPWSSRAATTCWQAQGVVGKNIMSAAGQV